MPLPTDMCLCGSNDQFGKCCSGILPGTKEIGRAFVSNWKVGNFNAVLKAARADVTQYTIWHKSHTVPMAHIGNPKLLRMWDIDVEALFDYVERLLDTYRELNRLEEFPAVLERLRQNIQSRRWQQKIVHLNALCALGRDWNEELGYREIIKLGPIESITDSRILPFYLNLAGDRLGLSQRLKLIDKVIDITQDESTRIHQTLMRGVLLLMHNDLRGAKQSFENVIRLCEEISDLDQFQMLKLAQAHCVIGSIALDSKEDSKVSELHLLRASELFSKLLEDDNLTASGRSSLHRELADTQRLQGHLSEAIESLRSGYKLYANPILKVFEAECLCELEQLPEGLKIIDSLSMASFSDDDERADYCLKFSLLAIASGERKRLLKAKQLLEMPLKREPIFYQQALRMTQLVLEAMQSGKSRSLTSRARKALQSGISGFNSYVILKPNFFGLGIDLNKIIDDSTGKYELPDLNEPREEKT